MIDTEKEYWFAFEPYVYITLKEKAALLYNTLDGEHIKVTDREALNFIAGMLDKKNCGVVRITSEEWQCSAIRNLLIEAREKFFADLYDCSLSDRKPVQFYPILNLQEEVKRLQHFNFGHVGGKMFTYLYKVTVNIEELEGEALCSLVNKIWNEVRPSSIKHLCMVISTPSQLDTLQAWIETHPEAAYCMEWIMKADLAFNCVEVINEPVTVIVKAGDLLPEKLLGRKDKNISWLFKVYTEEDLETASGLIDRYELQNYKVEPVYDHTNLSFFENQVFLTLEDIFSRPMSMQEVMRNQVLNTNNFGKLFITSEGDVYASNRFGAKIGNLHSESIRQLIHKEMTEGNSWLHIRNEAPCCNCIYQWMCPSPSDYEEAINKPNLCHVEK